MKKAGWKKCLCICLAGLSIGLCACGNEVQSVDSVETIDGFAGLGYQTYIPNGVFFTRGNTLYFWDNASSLEVVLCDRADCSHDTEDCYAYFSYATYAVTKDSGLLLVTGYGADVMGEMFLYQSDINGTNRKKLADLGMMQQIYQVCFTEDYIVIAYVNYMDENFQQMDESYAAVYVYDRAAGTGKEIWSAQAWNAVIFNAGIHGDDIYVNYHYSDLTKDETIEADPEVAQAAEHSQLLRISMEGEKKVICDRIEEAVIEFCKDMLFYRTADGELMGYDTVTEESKSFGETDMIPLITGVDEMTVLWNYDQEKKEYVYYVYQEETGVITQLGSHADMQITACYPDCTYAVYYGAPSGNGYAAFYNTQELLAGNLDSYTVYKNSDGGERYQIEALTDFSYDPLLEVKIEGEVETPEEAFAVMLEEFPEEPSEIQKLTAFYTVEDGVEMYSFRFETETAYYRYTVGRDVVDPFADRGGVSGSMIELKEW